MIKITAEMNLETIKVQGRMESTERVQLVGTMYSPSMCITGIKG